MNLGESKDSAYKLGGSGKGWWRLADTPQAHRAMSLTWFKATGLLDPEAVYLIGRFLRAGMMQNGVCVRREEGTPQGGPLSPLLARVVAFSRYSASPSRHEPELVQANRLDRS